MNWRNLKFIFKPNYWTMLGEYSEEWDKELNKLLDTEQFTHAPLSPFTSQLSAHHVKLGDYALWVSNFPYNCFTPCRPKSEFRAELRASRLTIERAYKLYIASDLDFAMMSESSPHPRKWKKLDPFIQWKRDNERKSPNRS